ncbi:hypothetical protein QOZ80_7AG0579340 [Eleusine coracana subsp. coracana]|nr:hypothetical protein QOZ80_7AG0579340 [Eleusine coracana subsp. coracana]
MENLATVAGTSGAGTTSDTPIVALNAPAEVEPPEQRPIIGVFKSHLKIGLVGLPAAGKSSLVKAVAETSTEDGYIPTVEPEMIRVNVSDNPFTWICEQYNPQSKEPPFFEMSDTPGLVRGAHIGEGHGNSFLDKIQNVDIIFYVLRAFEDYSIDHVDGVVDPVRDLDCLQLELQLKDVAFLQSRLVKLEKSMESKTGRQLRKDKRLMLESDLCLRLLKHLNGGLDVRFGDWNEDEKTILNEYNLLTAKPVVYLLTLAQRNFRVRRVNVFKTL